MDMLVGRPCSVSLRLAYWKAGQPMRGDETLDPARDGCGLIWYSPLVPMKPGSVRVYVDMVQRVCTTYKIDPLITLTSLSERCFDSTVPLLFNRTDEGEVAQAHACYEALFHAGRREGFLPYRVGVQSMHLIVEPSAPCWHLAATLKRALDPFNIIAPGRYAVLNPHPQLTAAS